ncbi:MAG: MFS transporter [Alphaproteobacteria bacterium]
MTILVSIGALLLSLSLLVAGNGLVGILLAVRMNGGGTDPQLIGLVLSCYSVGFVAGAFTAGHIVSRVGHIRSFAAFAAFACTAILIHSLDDSLVMWAALRVVTGFSVAAMFMVTESWLNERATNAVRGLMLSVYMVTNYTAAGAGQFLLNTGPIDGVVLFVYAAVLTVLSLVPLALTTSAQPQIPERRRFGLVRLYRISPLGLVAAGTIGIATGSFGSMGPVFAEAVGLDVEQVALFMGFGVISGLLLQFPIGLLSDRMDRRIVILGCNVAGAALATAIFLLSWLNDDRPPFLWLLVITSACMSVLFVLYPLCVAHANDFARPGESTGVAGGLLMVWGAGTIFGPIIGAAMMSHFGPASLWLTTTVLMSLTAGYAGWRMSRRPPAEDTVPFVAAPSVATPVSVQLDPRTEPMDEDVGPPSIEPVGAK